MNGIPTKASSTHQIFTQKYWVESESTPSRAPTRLRNYEFTQNFWVFSVYIADFWQTFQVIWENWSNWSKLRLKIRVCALGRLKILETWMFVLNAFFCHELKFVAILRSKLGVLLRNTGVDSDFTHNFWGKVCRLGTPTPSKSKVVACKFATHSDSCQKRIERLQNFINLL